MRPSAEWILRHIDNSSLKEWLFSVIQFRYTLMSSVPVTIPGDAPFPDKGTLTLLDGEFARLHSESFFARRL